MYNHALANENFSFQVMIGHINLVVDDYYLINFNYYIRQFCDLAFY